MAQEAPAGWAAQLVAQVAFGGRDSVWPVRTALLGWQVRAELAGRVAQQPQQGPGSKQPVAPAAQVRLAQLVVPEVLLSLPALPLGHLVAPEEPAALEPTAVLAARRRRQALERTSQPVGMVVPVVLAPPVATAVLAATPR